MITEASALWADAKPKTPRRFWLTLVELAALGVLGGGVFAFVVGLFSVGLGTIPLLGVGLALLVALVYVLFGIAWFEQRRVDDLYSFGLAPLRLARAQGPGFTNWLKSLWRQVRDGSMWRALASFAIASVFGTLILALAQGLVHNIFYTFVWLSPENGANAGGPWGLWGLDVSPVWAAVLGPLFAIGCLSAIVGLVLVSRPISEAIVAGPQRNAELNQQVAASTQQRAGAVRAADVERTRIERDLHDGVQPRLVSLGMTLGLAQEKIETDPVAAKALIEEAHTSTKAAITELRQLARGIHASVLDDRGLDAALSALASRSHIPVQLDVRIDAGRCREAEAAIYFAVAESLTNAAKHSRASECRVSVRSRDDGTIWARVEDNGLGGAQITPGGGLDGIMNRILAAGGTAQLQSPAGGPTALEVSVPCVS